MMLISAPVHILISSTLLLAVRATEIEISETCRPSYWNISHQISNIELPRPWTVNSTLTVLVLWTGRYDNLVVRLDGESSRSILSIVFFLKYDEISIVKNMSEGLWQSRFIAAIQLNESFTLSLTRGQFFYQVNVNGIPILSKATHSIAEKDPSLQVDPLDVHSRVTVTTQNSIIQNLCFWNRTNTIQRGQMSDKQIYAIKNTSHCTVQGERTFPDELYKRYIGQPLTENTVLNFVGKWSSANFFDIVLSTKRSSFSLAMVYYFRSQHGEVLMRDSLGNRIGESLDFNVDLPANELFRFDIERRRTFYEITINGLKFNVPQPQYQIDPNDVHDELHIIDGGRTIRNICVWKSVRSIGQISEENEVINVSYDEEMLEEDLLLPLQHMPLAIVVPSCLANRTCEDCWWFYGRDIVAERLPCRALLNITPYLVKVNDECRFIGLYASRLKKVNIHVCFDAISRNLDGY